MCHLHDLPDRIDCAERVRDVDDRDDARARAEQFLELVEHQLAGVGDGRHAQLGTLLFAQDLPRDDVRVMLHRRDEDLIAGLNVLAPEAGGDQVNRLGGAADEDDLLGLTGAEETLDFLPRRFELLGGALAKRMDAAVHVGVVRLVIALHFIDDALRFLCRRGVVEVDQGPTTNLLPQDRKVLADALDVERLGRRLTMPRFRWCRGCDAHGHTWLFDKGRSVSRRSSRSRKPAIWIRLMMSLAKAYVSRLLASSRPMPRERR